MLEYGFGPVYTNLRWGMEELKSEHERSKRLQLFAKRLIKGLSIIVRRPLPSTFGQWFSAASRMSNANAMGDEIKQLASATKTQTEKMQREYYDVARTMRMVKCMEIASFKVGRKKRLDECFGVMKLLEAKPVEITDTTNALFVLHVLDKFKVSRRMQSIQHFLMRLKRPPDVPSLPSLEEQSREREARARGKSVKSQTTGGAKGRGKAERPSVSKTRGRAGAKGGGFALMNQAKME